MPHFDNLSADALKYEAPGKTITRVVNLAQGEVSNYLTSPAGWHLQIDGRSWNHGTDTTTRCLFFPIAIPAPGATLTALDVLVADNSGTPTLSALMLRIEHDWATPARANTVTGGIGAITGGADQLIGQGEGLTLLQPNSDGLSHLVLEIRSGTGNGTKSFWGARYTFTTTEAQAMVAPG